MFGGFEQGLFARFPIFGQFALWRLECAFVDQSFGAQCFDCGFDPACAVERFFGIEGVHLDAQLQQVGADHARRGDLVDQKVPGLVSLLTRSQRPARPHSRAGPLPDLVLARELLDVVFGQVDREMDAARMPCVFFESSMQARVREIFPWM